MYRPFMLLMLIAGCCRIVIIMIPLNNITYTKIEFQRTHTLCALIKHVAITAHSAVAGVLQCTRLST